MGAEVIVAQGFEAGGHVRGVVSTLPLVPAVVDAVSPVPVIAAGGIADGRGLAAALALGAAGVWLGTRFVASEEAGLHSAYKARIAAAVETDTVYSSVFDVGDQTRHIGRCRTAPFDCGRRRAALPPAHDPARGRQSPLAPTGADSSLQRR